MIKKILLPTDLGELGDFAYTLASYIAEQSVATIDVISVVPGPRGAFYSPEGALKNDEGNDYSEWSRKLTANKAEMSAWLKGKSSVSNAYSVIGEVDDCIMRYAKDHEVDLIVMGTEGIFDKKIWSKPSHAQYISNHSPIPVLTLKCDRSNIHLGQIVFVGDFLVAKELDLSIVKSIQSLFNSKLLLLKIRMDDALRTTEQIHTDMEAFAQANRFSNYSMHIYDDNNVEAGIGKFCAEKNIDLIILGTHQHNGFSKLFRGSVSDDLVNHLFHPILTFPID